MSDHIVIINTPSTGGDRYLTRLITQIKQTPDLAALPVQIATHAYPEGLPDALRKMDVVHCHIDPGNSVQVNDLNIATASYIVILCQDENDLRSDSLTLDILDRINHQQNHAFIVAECIADDNRERFKRLQANAVIRPIRSYPELVVRALSAPGTECVLENLFTHGGSSTRRFDVRLHQIQWQAVACKLIQANIGTPLGFINDSGEVITNPDGNTVITGCALLIMVNDNHHTANSNVIDLLQ